MKMSLFLIAVLSAALFALHPARAAQSYDNCTGYIDSVPATISTQGTWCLRGDLATSINSGNAIEIAANNVTLDCNDFKLGGLAAGASSQTIGIHATERQNVTVRHCNVRGFHDGIFLTGTGGLIENNRLDSNRQQAIYVDGERNMVRSNRIYDTGGFDSGNGTSKSTVAVLAKGDIIDNIVDGVTTTDATVLVEGIASWGANGTRISGNRIGGLALTGGTGQAKGIDTLHSVNLAISGNRIVAETPGTHGLAIDSDSSNLCGGNTAANFVMAIVADSCTNTGGNDRL